MSGIPPITPVESNERERGSSSKMKNFVFKLIDKKVQRLILGKIQSSSPLLLYVSDASPDMVSSFIYQVCHPQIIVSWGSDKGRKMKLKDKAIEKLVSIHP